MQYTYLIVNFFIVIFPLLFSFESKISFYKKWKQLFWSALPVSMFFILWDVWATSRGHWSFNPEYTTGLKVINLPIEEILFFITVPYSCLFLYEVVSWYFRTRTLTTQQKRMIHNMYRRKQIEIRAIYLICMSLVLAYHAFANVGLEYTGIVLFVGSLVGMLVLSEVKSITYTWWILLCTGLFFLTNLVLTGLPIVSYGPDFILELKVVTIPVEDFLYNWSLLGLYLYSYKRICSKVKKL